MVERQITILIFTKRKCNAMRFSMHFTYPPPQTLSLEANIFSCSDNFPTPHILFHFIHSAQHLRLACFPIPLISRGCLLIWKGQLGSRLLHTIITLQKFKFLHHQKYRHSLYITCSTAAEKTGRSCLTMCKERTHTSPC